MSNAIKDYMGTLIDPSHTPSGIYRARVENNMDPKNMGRVRIRVPMFHGDASTGLPSSGLPWAYPSSQSAGYGYGTFLVPEVGEYVFVMFEDNNLDYPIYLGSSYGCGSSKPKVYGSKDGQGQWKSDPGVNEVPTEARRAEPTRKVIYKSPKGASVEVDESNGQEKIMMTDALGQMVKIESNLTKGVSHKRYQGDLDSLGDVTSFTSGARMVVKAAGKQYIELTSKDGVNDIKLDIGNEGKYTIHLLDDNGAISATFKHKNGSIILMNDEGVTIHGVQFLNLSSAQTMEISAPQTIDINAGQVVNITGGQTVNVNGGQTVHVNGGSSVIISAPSIILDGNVTIVGS